MDTSRKGKKNKIRIDYGMSDYYKFYTKKYGKIPEHKLTSKLYNAIVNEFNKSLASMLTDKGKDITLPFNIGIIGIRKYTPEIKVEDNKIVKNTLPINPLATRKLWDSNPEAKEKKIYVRYTNKHSDGYVFSIHYFRYKAKFKNKKIYNLSPKRDLKRRVSRNIKEKVIDAFILKSRDYQH